jgi:hypothetical protein
VVPVGPIWSSPTAYDPNNQHHAHRDRRPFGGGLGGPSGQRDVAAGLTLGQKIRRTTAAPAAANPMVKGTIHFESAR